MVEQFSRFRNFFSVSNIFMNVFLLMVVFRLPDGSFPFR